MKFSFQTYSARNFTPWDRVFQALSSLGYSQVEGFGAIYEDAAVTRSLLDANSLTMPSGHFSLDALENDLDGTLNIATTLGCTHVFCPYLAEDQRPVDLNGWSAFASRLARLTTSVTDRGFHFGWHNHDFEFNTCADGTVPMRVILESAPGMEWEMDVAWVARAGADPFAWIKDFGSRITAIHVKDIAAPGECTDEDGWADVGFGTMDWGALLTQISKHTPADLWVAEHDNPSDFERFASRSLDSIKRLG